MITKDEKCPFCGAYLIAEDHCQSCHAFQIKGYVSRDARTRINLVSIGTSLLVALFGILVVFLVSFGIGAYIAIIAFSLVFYFIMKKILYVKEEKKGKVVWKRAIITW
ncbi:TPA: hypothetical protein M2P46_002059 [Klebsiella variicola]|uniref:hypothetical protein n=1 Tax=Klebsiella variicola TaxID=244366 RepID=UPI00109158CB|nr:hypothetical protein [Klebsiella variicola]HBY9450039.1 hypothetical protein [Klebsiella pneumoniae]HCB9203674.1 hypothetical protein [Klebsiella variicola]HDK6444805.1 hypothetical protein [Klebsiella variicola]